MADSRNKGKRGEYQIRDLLAAKTGLEWARVPGSGGFGASHGLKGDVYLPTTTGRMSRFAIEVKWYKDEHFNSTILKESASQLDKWLEQAYRESVQMSAKPMLVFKKDRGNWMVAIDLADVPQTVKELDGSITSVVYTGCGRQVFIMLFEEFLELVDTEYLVK